mgnify:FL=1
MTEKLYEHDPYLSRHSATVLSCDERGGKYEVVLDRTAFFPEGGGQAYDTGTIDNAPVIDVQIQNEIITHLCDEPLTVGGSVICEVDAAQRLRRMQCHSGEHIVSGLIHRLHGLDNVGFHLGSSDVTLDTSGTLSDDELQRIEYLANEAVAKNVPIRAIYPTPDELSRYDYRSKLDLTDGVRLIEIPGYDLCACCAPHVRRTGEIGMIKLISHINYKGGLRIHMLCGARALDDYSMRCAQTSAIGELLSVKDHECADAVASLLSRLDDSKRERDELVRSIIAREAEAARPTDGNLVFVLPQAFAQGLRELVNLALPKCGGICAAFAGSDGTYTFIAASTGVDLRAISKEMLSALSGKGGGRPEMIHGSVTCTAADIHRYFETE